MSRRFTAVYGQVSVTLSPPCKGVTTFGNAWNLLLREPSAIRRTKVNERRMSRGINKNCMPSSNNRTPAPHSLSPWPSQSMPTLLVPEPHAGTRCDGAELGRQDLYEYQSFITAMGYILTWLNRATEITNAKGQANMDAERHDTENVSYYERIYPSNLCTE
ncbi:hypothetical protein RRG08_048407 [Elysia crispata]|uniref:Uncharacterized protein n=1 Tax=Elysia crispata TaxID=231223 RepID=A0AAE1B9J4_9GAST|nr:hypothetical protein RRG08_048407 [Elysia crispata]